MISVTVFFDARWGYPRARFRGPGFDKKERVPDDFLRDRGIDPGKWTPQAERVATEWAFVRKAQLTGERPSGKVTPSGAMTLEEIHELYRRRNPEGVQAITAKKNAQLFKHLVAFEPFVTLAPEAIDSGAALDYFEARTKVKASPRSIANEIRFLVKLLDAANEWQRETGVTVVRLRGVPKRVLLAGKTSEHKGIALTPAQFFALLEQHVDKRELSARFKRALVVGVTTGLRRENLLALRWSWIDRKNQWLNIPAKHMKGRTAEKRDLSIPLCAWAMEAIGERRGASDFVFASPAGGRTWRFDNTLKSFADAARVPRFTLHDLRRTGSTWLATRGVDERVIGALLGHKQRVNRLGQRLIQGGNVTSSKYLFVDDDELRSAVSEFDALREEHGKLSGNRRILRLA